MFFGKHCMFYEANDQNICQVGLCTTSYTHSVTYQKTIQDIVRLPDVKAQ